MNLQRDLTRSEDVHVVLQHGSVFSHRLGFGAAGDGRGDDRNRIARAAQAFDNVPSCCIRIAPAREVFGLHTDVAVAFDEAGYRVRPWRGGIEDRHDDLLIAAAGDEIGGRVDRVALRYAVPVDPYPDALLRYELSLGATERNPGLGRDRFPVDTSFTAVEQIDKAFSLRINAEIRQGVRVAPFQGDAQRRWSQAVEIA